MNSPSTATARPYMGDSDLEVIKSFLSRFCTELHPTHRWHLGNLLWSMYFSTTITPLTSLRLWQDSTGSVVGIAWFDEPNMLDMQLDPLQRDGALREDALSWGTTRARASQRESDNPTLVTWAGEDDNDQIRFLAKHGFTRKDFQTVHMSRSLSGKLPPPALPAGWSVRHIDAEEEFDERVALHRDAWHPSHFARESYDRLRGAPGYIPELDIVVVRLDGAFASYCIC